MRIAYCLGLLILLGCNTHDYNLTMPICAADDIRVNAVFSRSFTSDGCVELVDNQSLIGIACLDSQAWAKLELALRHRKEQRP